MRAVHVEGLPSEPRGRLARTGDHMSLLGEHMHVGINDACPLEAALQPICLSLGERGVQKSAC